MAHLEESLLLGPDAALEEAWRCLQCADPPCQKGCPARVEVKTFIRKIRCGDLRGAALVIRRNNILGASCARVCAQAEQCQAECTRARLDRAVDIRALQRFVTDWELEKGILLPEPAPATGKKVAVVGAGPAGLATAAELCRLGHRVTVFEKTARPGGMLVQGIPQARLAETVVGKEVAALEKAGVNFVREREIKSRSDLDGFDAVVVAVGMYRPVRLEIPGEDLPGVQPALEFLAWRLRGEKPGVGERVVVVGGGNTAMDAASEAVRLGAREVSVLYRRSENEMPAWPEEVARARRLGVNIRPLSQPLEFMASGGRLSAVKCTLCTLGPEDESGRRKPVPLPGAYFVLPAERVLIAAGESLDEELARGLGLRVEGGRLVLDEAGRARAEPGVFAAGDLTGSRRTVVDAVGAGYRAARQVHEYLMGRNAAIVPFVVKPARVDLAVDFLGVRFSNPFVLAAAPPTDDLEMVRSGLAAGWAGAVLKTTAIEGEPVELKYPMMQGYQLWGRRVAGLGNIDLISEHHIDVVEERVRQLKREFPDRVIIGSIMGSKKEDWQQLVRRLEEAGVDMIECSFSCPQGTLGGEGSFAGQMLGQNVELTRQVTSWIKQAARRVPVVIKITPQVADIRAVARAVAEGGADGICASNTIPSLMGLDLESLRPLPTVQGRTSFAGLSGPVILPITLRNLALVAEASGLPVTGTGGPFDWRDAVQMMLVGATTVQFCTAVMTFGYEIIEDLTSGLQWYLQEKGLHSPAELVGRSLPYITTHDRLVGGRKVRSRLDQERCIGCGRCFVTCRDGGHRAIEFSAGRQPRVDDERCVGCGMCLAVCPVSDCISLVEIP
jgi:dihydropyrimidine dehydrogenase (NAD+) subunit PreA